MAAICSVCQIPIDGADVFYSMQGNPICSGCQGRASLETSIVGAARNITSSAVTALLLGIFGWIFNPFLLVSIFAILAGVYALKSVRPDNAPFSTRVSSNRGLIQALAIVGIVLAGLRLLLVVFFLMGLAF